MYFVVLLLIFFFYFYEHKLNNYSKGIGNNSYKSVRTHHLSGGKFVDMVSDLDISHLINNFYSEIYSDLVVLNYIIIL